MTDRRRRRNWGRALAGLLLPILAGCQSFAQGGLAGCSAGAAAEQFSGPGMTAAEAAAADAPPAGYPFGPRSVWRSDVRSAPLAHDSKAVVGYLAQGIARNYGGIAAFNVHKYENSFYVTRAGTPTVDVAFDDCQHKGFQPAGLSGPGGQFTAVPIPAGAVPSAGTDSTLSIYSPASDQLWEFWRMHRSAQGGWAACWGGRMDAASQSPGYFLHGFGTSASGLSTTGGMVSLADVRSGRIDHALSLVVTNAATWKRVSWPAQRSDGWDTDPRAVPEGTRLRLDPGLDVDALHLAPIAAMIARAAQTYGFVVTDKGGAVAVTAEGGEAEQAETGTDPWTSLLGGLPDYAVLQNFPWQHLQALPQNYGRPASADPSCA